MGTHIYTGFELVGHDMNSAAVLLQKFKLETLRPLVLETKAKTLATDAVYRLDLATLGSACDDTYTMCSHIYNAEDVMRDHQKKAKLGERQPDYDYGFEVALIEHRGRMFGIYYCEQNVFAAAFRQLPGVSDFSYTDSTDDPGKVPVKEWRARGKLWNAIFKGAVTCADDAGLSITLSHVDGGSAMPTRDMVMQHLPALDKRVKNVALEIASAKMVASGEVENTMSGMMRVHKHPRYTEICNGIRAALKPEITWEDLMGETPGQAYPDAELTL